MLLKNLFVCLLFCTLLIDAAPADNTSSKRRKIDTQEIVQRPSLVELLLQRRAGIISPEQFMHHVVDQDKVVQYMERMLLPKEKNIVTDEAPPVFGFVIVTIKDYILSRPESFMNVLTRMDSYPNKEFLKKSLCEAFFLKRDPQSDEMIKDLFSVSGLDINGYYVLMNVIVDNQLDQQMLRARFTPLGIAIRRRNISMVKMLLERGADVHLSVIPQIVVTPLELLQDYEQPEIRALLEEAAAREQAQAQQEQA